MNGATLAVFVLALLSFVPIAQGSQQVPQLTPFLDIDFDWPRSKDNKFELAQGAIVQITVERSAYGRAVGKL